MRKFLFLLLILCFSGCMSVNMPHYIQDKNPYKKTFYSNFNDVLKTTLETLKELGWVLSKKVDPTVFERTTETNESQTNQILLFTEIRQTSLFIASRYARINVYLRSGTENTTEVEIRYLTVNSFPFKNFYNYRNDHAIEQIWKLIKKKLG